MVYPDCNVTDGPVGARCHEHKVPAAVAIAPETGLAATPKRSFQGYPGRRNPRITRRRLTAMENWVSFLNECSHCFFVVFGHATACMVPGFEVEDFS